MTFRTRLVLAATAAAVVAVLAASLGSFLVARHTLLQAADSSLTTAAQKVVAGQEIGSTTATLGQVIDTTGAVVSGGGLPVTGQVRLVAVNLAPAFFTTVTVDGNQMREYVEHLPAGSLVEWRDRSPYRTRSSNGSLLDHLGRPRLVRWLVHAPVRPPRQPLSPAQSYR